MVVIRPDSATPASLAFLFIGSHDVVRRTMELAFAEGEGKVDAALNLAEGERLIEGGHYDAVFVLSREAGPDPPEFVQRLRDRHGGVHVEVLTGTVGNDMAVIDSALERARLAHENQRLQDELKRARREFVRREGMAAVGRLVAGLCHEFNNPLAFILSNLENLGEYAVDLRRVIEAYRARLTSQGPLDEGLRRLEAEVDLEFIVADAERAARDSSVGAKRLRELIAALRTYATFDGKECEVVDLRKVCTQALAILAKPIRDRAVVELEGPVGVYAVANSGQITQAIVALVQNSLDAFGGRPTRENKVHILVEPRGTHAAVVIVDNGPRITADVRTVLDPFFAASSQGRAIGVGLAIAASIAEDHGGELALSATEHGPGFAFVLPGTHG
jgi:C4-dicarboxylate-specific signal transduction histidine kinase